MWTLQDGLMSRDEIQKLDKQKYHILGTHVMLEASVLIVISLVLA